MAIFAPLHLPLNGNGAARPLLRAGKCDEKSVLSDLEARTRARVPGSSAPISREYSTTGRKYCR
jgi:hypothetical protein